jgi:hypothetical protein
LLIDSEIIGDSLIGLIGFTADAKPLNIPEDIPDDDREAIPADKFDVKGGDVPACGINIWPADIPPGGDEDRLHGGPLDKVDDSSEDVVEDRLRTGPPLRWEGLLRGWSRADPNLGFHPSEPRGLSNSVQ